MARKKPINIGKEMQIRYYEVISIKRGMNKDELKSLKLIIARVDFFPFFFFVSVRAIVILIIDRVDRNTAAVEVICMSHSLQVAYKVCVFFYCGFYTDARQLIRI